MKLLLITVLTASLCASTYANDDLTLDQEDVRLISEIRFKVRKLPKDEQCKYLSRTVCKDLSKVNCATSEEGTEVQYADSDVLQDIAAALERRGEAIGSGYTLDTFVNECIGVIIRKVHLNAKLANKSLSSIDSADMNRLVEENKSLKTKLNEMNKLVEQNESLKNQLKESEVQSSEMKKLQDSVMQTKLADSHEKSEELERFKADRNELLKKLESSAKQSQEFQSEVKRLNQEMSFLQAKAKESDEKSEKLDRLKADKDELAKELASSNEQSQELRSEVKRLNQEMSFLLAKVKDSEEKSKEFDRLKARYDELERKHENLVERSENSQFESKRLNQEINKMSGEFEAVRENFRSQASNLNDIIKSKSEDLDATIKENRDLQDRVRNLEEDVAKLNYGIQRKSEVLSEKIKECNEYSEMLYRCRGGMQIWPNNFQRADNNNCNALEQQNQQLLAHRDSLQGELKETKEKLEYTTARLERILHRIECISEADCYNIYGYGR